MTTVNLEEIEQFENEYGQPEQVLQPQPQIYEPSSRASSQRNLRKLRSRD